jgi:hypothetical protein
MSFMLRKGWYCQFLEPDLKTSLRRKLNFADVDKVRQMQERFGADRMLADKSAFEHALENGRGGIWLNLTDEQYKICERSVNRILMGRGEGGSVKR